MHFQYIPLWYGQRPALRAFHVTLGRVELYRADRWRPGPASLQSTRNASGAQSGIVKTQVGQAPLKCCTNHDTIVGPRGDVMQSAPVLACGWSSVHILATLSDCLRLFACSVMTLTRHLLFGLRPDGMRVRRFTRQGIATFETPQRRLSHAKHGMRLCLYQIALADVHRSRLVYCRHLARVVNPTSQTSRIFLTGPLYKIISFAPATSFPEDEKLRDGGWGRTVSNNLNAKSKVPTRNRSRPAKYVRM